MEELPGFIRKDVLKHSNGLVYKFCSDQEPTARHARAPPSSPLVRIADKSTSARSEPICLQYPGITLLRTGDHPILGLGAKNPYDQDHPDYNDTDPAGPCFVRSGWYSDASTAVVSSTMSPAPTNSINDSAIPFPHVMPLLSSYNVLSAEDAVPVALDGSHQLLMEEDIDYQQLVKPMSPCAYGLWVRQLILRIRFN